MTNISTREEFWMGEGDGDGCYLLFSGSSALKDRSSRLVTTNLVPIYPRYTGLS